MGLGALAKGFTDGFRAAQDTRFRREDAEYKKYERDRKKKEDEQFDAGKNAALEELGKEDGGIDVGGTLGLRAPSTFRPAVQGKPGESVMDNTAAGLAGPNAPQIETPGAGLQLQRGAQYGQDKAMLRRLAGMARDPAQLEALMKSARQLKIDSDVAAISERVMSATPEEAARWADMVSADKRNGFKAKPDPKNPGLMLVEEGGTKLALDRSQMAKFLAANHRLKLGDRTAMADLEAFDKDLAARINETYTRARNDSADARENFKALDTANYHKGALANDSARTGLARDRAKQEDWSIVGASDDNKGLLRFNRRTGATEVQPLPAGVDAAGLFRRVTGNNAGQDQGLKVNPDGSVISGGKLYVPDPNRQGAFIPAKGLQPSALDLAIEASQKQTPSGGAQPAVPGRPLYGASTADLQRMVSKPRGVSSEEARDAANELSLRMGESRMSSF